MKTPALSVAMSVYNGERFLAEAIDSILAQSFADFEFLILDDGSTDRTPAILRAHAARDARIRPIVRENRGLVASLNQLLGEARAPIIARMDADDIALPDRFATQLAFLAGHPDHGVIGSWSEDIDEHGHRIKVAGTDHPVDHAAVMRAIAQGGQVLCHPSAMYRRDVVCSVGSYHSAFRHCEDLDLWLRLASVTKIANVPQRLIRYRRFAEQVSRRHSTEQQIGTAVAWIAYEERAAGRFDPTAELAELPPLDELDALFGRAGVAARVREHVAARILWSPEALRDAGFDLLLRHVRDGGLRRGGTREDMWRTVLRLIRFGMPLRAMRLAATLARRG